MSKIYVKTSLSLIFGLMLTACGAIQYASIPGESKADLVLKHDVSKQLLRFASINLEFASNNPNCIESVSVKNIVDTQLVYRSANQNFWKEIWFVKICNKTIPYEISFSPDGSGGTYFNISQRKLKPT